MVPVPPPIVFEPSRSESTRGSSLFKMSYLWGPAVCGAGPGYWAVDVVVVVGTVGLCAAVVVLPPVLVVWWWSCPKVVEPFLLESTRGSTLLPRPVLWGPAVVVLPPALVVRSCPKVVEPSLSESTRGSSLLPRSVLWGPAVVVVG